VEACRGRVAVARGPVVYCLESPDLPKGVHLDQVRLPAGVRLTPRPGGDWLGGATVLEGEAIVGDGRRVRLSLIPYYAWANRGISHMAVWLPAE
jgi:DUF1680 family protein